MRARRDSRPLERRKKDRPERPVGRPPRREPVRSPRRSFHVKSPVAAKARTEDELFQIVKEAGASAFILILDSIQDPHNLGACLRSADAAGVHAVVASKDRSVAITDAVRRISTGGADHVPFVQVTNLARTMSQLKEAGLWLIGTADQATKSIYDMDLSGPIALVMGNEGEGLRRLTMETCDHLVKIPMKGQVECLNVSVATGVCLFETVRQRSRQK